MQLGNGMSVQIASAQGLIPKTGATRCFMSEYDKKEMAGYSGTPLAQKLGIKAGQKVVTIGGPASFRKLLAPLPDAVSFVTKVEPGATCNQLRLRHGPKLQPHPEQILSRKIRIDEERSIARLEQICVCPEISDSHPAARQRKDRGRRIGLDQVGIFFEATERWADPGEEAQAN
jgi:hypothetical protein